MITRILKLKCLTNLHVGSGDENFDVIDNSVERDPVTNYPTINSSGVKGALREAFNINSKPDIEDIFGAEGDAKPGKLKILSANLIARPMRASKGASAYELVTTKCAIDTFNAISKALKANICVADNTIANTYGFVEGIECPVTDALNKFFGIERILIMDEQSFGTIALPVIARNKLENGKSKTLWYEEIVPHQSVFYLPVVANDNDAAVLESFIKSIKDLTVIQFGGNASIGQGLCEVSILEG